MKMQPIEWEKIFANHVSDKGKYPKYIRNLYASTGVAQWVRHHPANQKVTGSIPSQGTCLGCRPGPQLGACKRQLID